MSDKNISYGAHRLQRYDVHYDIRKKELKTIFYIHGGSWMSMDKKHYNYIVKTIAERGYRIININYRMLPRYDLSTVVTDCESAVCHAIDTVPGIDTDNLMIMGDSAGGHLAALIAAKANSGAFRKNIKFKAAAIFYGLLDMDDMIYSDAWLFKFLTKYFHKETGLYFKEYLTGLSPRKFINENFPKTFLASGKVDALNPATMSFIKILDEIGIEHSDYILPEDRKDGLHGFLSYTWLRSSKEALKAVIEFFEGIN
ncbi:MAG: alpha/beta hydrolase [Christensenellales bacterium]